jgi:hypothetical protein
LILSGQRGRGGREHMRRRVMRLREIITERKSEGGYQPTDLFQFPETIANAREWFRRSALRDGLDPEAAEEAASVAMMAWIERDYSASGIARGDHPRALFATRKWMRRSVWKGASEYRRSQARTLAPITGSEASRSPTPEAIVAALEAATVGGLSFVPFREKWARRGFKKVGRGTAARFDATGRKDHREIRRSRIVARRVIAEAAKVGGLVAVFMPADD